jgi:hypothetical protein
VADVERIAGRGSAQVIRPLISAEFLEPRERRAARAALALPSSGHVVVVSGGGWGVGDLEGAVAELMSLSDTTVVCVAGRNEPLRERLTERFGACEQVRVLGFTDRMPDLLAAADVLVHSTGGVTCLEAMARGCPVVAYGLPVGHAKLNTKAMAEHEYVLFADSAGELVEHVSRGCIAQALLAPCAAIGATVDAASVVLRAPRRVSPIARWRLLAANVAAALLLTMGAGTWAMSTDELDALAAPLVHQVKTLKTNRPLVLVVVRAPVGAAATVARRMAADGLEGSIATTTIPRAAALQAIRRQGDQSIPAIGRTGFLGWIHTPSTLRRDARALHLHKSFFYLEPLDPTFGQLLLSRTAGGVPVRGSVALDARTPLPAREFKRGDVVVVAVNGSKGSYAELDRLADALASDGLAGEPLSVLAAG